MVSASVLSAIMPRKSLKLFSRKEFEIYASVRKDLHPVYSSPGKILERVNLKQVSRQWPVSLWERYVAIILVLPLHSKSSSIYAKFCHLSFTGSRQSKQGLLYMSVLNLTYIKWWVGFTNLRRPCYRLTRQMQSTLYLICISFQHGHHDQIAKLVEVKCFFLQRSLEMSERRNENCFFICSLSNNWEVSFFQQGVYSLFGVAVGGVHLYLGDIKFR